MELGLKSDSETIDSLYFALLASAVEDMRILYTASHGGGDLERTLSGSRFSLHERGQFAGSATLLHESEELVDLPAKALQIAHKVLAIERQHGQIDELFAAAVAGEPWEFSRQCLCGQRMGTWRPVYARAADIPGEQAWRYERPENHVPLCYRCAARFGWRVEAVRVQLAMAVWGHRFEAFTRWQTGSLRGTLPRDWDKARFPLWPSRFGRGEWGSGSGALDCSDPRPPDSTCRDTVHIELLESFYPVGTRRRRTVTSPLRPSPASLR
jgi:hypothetical protein